VFECWSRLSLVFSWKFVCYLYPVQHDSTSKQSFHSKMFFEKWNGNEKPKKITQKREPRLGNDKWYNQMGKVGTSWSTWDMWDQEKGSDLSGTSGTRRRGYSDLRGTSGTRTRGLSTLTIPLVPNGTTRPSNLHLSDLFTLLSGNLSFQPVCQRVLNFQTFCTTKSKFQTISARPPGPSPAMITS